MKLYDIKGIMLGIGIGLVLSSIVNININQKALNDDFIKAEASKRGFIILNPGELIDKEKTNESMKHNEKIENNEQKDEEIKIEVLKGYTPYDTAELLLNSGLILDKNEFINRIKEKNRERKIQYGVFIIKKGTSYDDIIDIITAP